MRPLGRGSNCFVSEQAGEDCSKIFGNKFIIVERCFKLKKNKTVSNKVYVEG